MKKEVEMHELPLPAATKRNLKIKMVEKPTTNTKRKNKMHATPVGNRDTYNKQYNIVYI